MPVNPESLDTRIKVLNERTQAGIAKLPVNLRQELSSKYHESYIRFLNNPGSQTLIHGDASLSNFLCDVEKEEVYFVDLETFSKSKQSDGYPSGTPAEDYHRFLGDMVWLDQIYPKAPETIIAAQSAFKTGYSTLPSLITDEADVFFHNYWNLRNKNYKI